MPGVWSVGQLRKESRARDMPERGAIGAFSKLIAVRARLVDRAEDWVWSSARAHLAGHDDCLVEVAPLLDRLGDFETFLDASEDQQATRMLRAAETTGRPAGSPQWLSGIEKRSGRSLAPKKRGPKPRPDLAEVSGI
jgi:putative transposase